MYDSIIIGAGIAGSTTARKLAEEKNKKIINYKQELEKIEARQMQEHELMPKEA